VVFGFGKSLAFTPVPQGLSVSDAIT